MNKKNKILAICEIGSVRSACFTNILKLEKNYSDVLNCGIQSVDAQTLALLCKWADHIYVTADTTVWRRFPHIFRKKATFVDIGKDIWHNPEDPQLKQIMRKRITELGL